MLYARETKKVPQTFSATGSQIGGQAGPPGRMGFRGSNRPSVGIIKRDDSIWSDPAREC